MSITGISLGGADAGNYRLASTSASFMGVIEPPLDPGQQPGGRSDNDFSLPSLTTVQIFRGWPQGKLMESHQWLEILAVASEPGSESQISGTGCQTTSAGGADGAAGFTATCL